MDTAYFRAGVGAVIYNTDGQIVIFKRASHPIGVWQFPQGGIDAGEDPEITLWRELEEETGLTKDAFLATTPYPHWTTYEYPDELRLDPQNPNPERLGQAHRWWFLALKPETSINLETASDHEFSDFEWTTFDALLDHTNDFKHHVYEALRAFFQTHIR